MRRSCRSALRCAKIVRLRPTRWPAARRWPITHRCARRCGCSMPAVESSASKSSASCCACRSYMCRSMRRCGRRDWSRHCAVGRRARRRWRRGLRWQMIRRARLRKPIPGAVPRLSQALELLQATRATQAFSTWVPLWVAAIEAGPWIQRSHWSSVEFQAAERFRELLGALAAADAVIGKHWARVGAARVAPRRARYGLPAADRRARRLDQRPVNRSVASSYDGLWVTGCSDERWPPPVMPVALLPIRRAA